MSNNLVILTTAGDCGACTRFKERILNEVIDDLKRYDFIHIDLTRRDQKDAFLKRHGYPSNLSKWIEWYPITMILDREDFNNNRMNGMILGGDLSSGFIEQNKDELRTYTSTPDMYLSWINENINKKGSMLYGDDQTYNGYDSDSGSIDGVDLEYGGTIDVERL